MDILKMLAELRAERKRIEQAILTFERVAAKTRGRRRGRPPKWMSLLNNKDLMAPVSKKKRV
jgi:hypothetical protein